MILTKFNSSTFATEIVAKGTAKDIIDCVSKLAENNKTVKPDCIIEDGVVKRDYMQFDTIIAGIRAGHITGFRIDSGTDDGVYSILDPDAPVKPLFSKEETIKSIKGDMYDTYVKMIQERFASLMKDAESLGLSLAYFPTDCNGMHLVAIPANIERVENKPDGIPAIKTIDLVKDLPYIDSDKVITLYMCKGGADRFCYRK
jgi:hypothetical protein